VPVAPVHDVDARLALRRSPRLDLFDRCVADLAFDRATLLVRDRL